VIQDDRIRRLNAGAAGAGRYVLYWMQASCRAECNHALEHAIREANALGKPVLACFGLTADFPEANARHYTFLLEGLRDAEAALERRGIPLVVRHGAPDEVATALARDACLVVTDRGYLRVQREWRDRAAVAIPRALVEVESDVVVPVETAAARAQYAAATLRPRLGRQLARFLVPLRATRLRARPLAQPPAGLALDDVPALVRGLGVDGSVPPAPALRGGSRAAEARLRDFLARGLAGYDEGRNDPGLAGQSGLSPYLHFGHISPLRIALAVRERAARASLAAGPSAEAFLEELIVRRELSVNMVRYDAAYDRFAVLPAWCRATLLAHAKDRRPHLYTPRQLEGARTHDPYWNAAQTEMVLTGTMHGYMRMYWGKKILEWTESPERAFRTALRLNNRYQLDGRDPNSFAGVAWVFGKHDRPWAERPIFGLVRYMNAAGLERKFDMKAYVERVARLIPAAPGPLSPAAAAPPARGRRTR
jgi:deoxyribodipyrimidine photo-lyase